MATMTFTMQAPSAEMERSFTLPDADVPRIITWAMAAYPNTDPEAESVTPNEAMLRWLVGTLNGTMSNVVRYEEEEARKALSTPPAIDIAPV